MREEKTTMAQSTLSIPPIQIPSIQIHPIKIPPFLPGMIRVYTPPSIHIPPIQIPTSPDSPTDFDFPSLTPPSSTIATQTWTSSISSIFLRCLQCEIPLSRVEKGSNPDICRSCETIQYEVRWNGKIMPQCMACLGNAWRMHRACKRFICRRCANNFEKCPSCFKPLE
jgi:hypothetical protein